MNLFCVGMILIYFGYGFDTGVHLDLVRGQKIDSLLESIIIISPVVIFNYFLVNSNLFLSLETKSNGKISENIFLLYVLISLVTPVIALVLVVLFR